MRKYFVIILLMLGGLFAAVFYGNKTAVSAPAGPHILITQIKVSAKGQFVTLYNNTSDSIDLNTIRLQYYNNYDLLAATSSKLIRLSGFLPARGFAVVNDGTVQVCSPMTINSASLGFSTVSGFVQVDHFFSSASPQVAGILDDYISWNKSDTSGAQKLPAGGSAFLQRKTTGTTQAYADITSPGAGEWDSVQEADGSILCDATAAPAVSGGARLAPGNTAIPYTTVSAASALSSIPASDNGLAAPQISEVAPNPAPPKTDADDEFIELYNSNDKEFDLSGFVLQVGTTTTHKYTFPGGTSLEPQKFAAFYSSDTGLSLSNNEGQVKLLDPGGNLLAQTDEYSAAKDDYSWVYAAGLWQWTTAPTPGAENKIVSPSPNKSSSSPAAKTAVKGAKTAASAGGSPAAGNFSTAPETANLHPLALAGIGSLALLYALYEYRHDLGNLLYKFRRNRAARRTVGQ